jgi:hypothetical protein
MEDLDYNNDDCFDNIYPSNRYETQAKIYKIIPKCETEVYIGSTIRSLYERFKEHKKDNNSCRSKFLLEKYGKSNCKIVLIENYKCKNRQELEEREFYWINTYPNCINKLKTLPIYDTQKVYTGKKCAICEKPHRNRITNKCNLCKILSFCKDCKLHTIYSVCQNCGLDID